ncbi:hypothetical protein DH2020_008613 [Rehmannia glutinosa]|uniref:Uncharacterized protein n=1 Tax=Rehmannia glutinosa TaxID=99300 RepID=A0ABR0X7J9_REHGL
MPKGVPKEPKSRSENARWPIQNERLLIEFMHEEFLQGQLLTSTFSSYVWGNICGRLNEEHPDNAATIERGLPHYNYCTDMFASNVATGSMARSSMQPPVESDEEGQVDP